MTYGVPNRRGNPGQSRHVDVLAGRSGNQGSGMGSERIESLARSPLRRPSGFDFDINDRLAHIRHAKDAAGLFEVNYGYDAAGGRRYTRGMLASAHSELYTHEPTARNAGAAAPSGQEANRHAIACPTWLVRSSRGGGTTPRLAAEVVEQ